MRTLKFLLLIIEFIAINFILCPYLMSLNVFILGVIGTIILIPNAYLIYKLSKKI